MDRRHRESEGKAKIEGYMSVSDEEAHHRRARCFISSSSTTWALCDDHQLYPIPITPSAQYHIRDLPYDLWTTLLHFPFLVSSLLPDASFCGLTNQDLTIHFTAHKPCARFTYCLYLRLLYLLQKKKEVFPRTQT